MSHSMPEWGRKSNFSSMYHFRFLAEILPLPPNKKRKTNRSLITCIVSGYMEDTQENWESPWNSPRLCSPSHVWLFVTPWTVARQVLLSMDFSGKNSGMGCHFLLRGSSQPRDWSQVSCIVGIFFTICDTGETLKWSRYHLKYHLKLNKKDAGIGESVMGGYQEKHSKDGKVVMGI